MATIVIPNRTDEEKRRDAINRANSRWLWHTCVDDDHSPCGACLAQVEKQLLETGEAECCNVLTRTDREFVRHLVSVHHMEEKGAWEMVFPHATAGSIDAQRSEPTEEQKKAFTLAARRSLIPLEVEYPHLYKHVSWIRLQ